MGNVFSTDLARGAAIADVTSESETMSDTSASYEDAEEFHDTFDDDATRVKAKEEEMEAFKKELTIKREQRKIILARHRAEKEKLEKALDDTKKENLKLNEKNKLMRELLLQNNIQMPENLQSTNALTDLSGAIAEMKEEFESLKKNNNKLRRDLAESNVSLQNAYSDIADLNTQNIESMKHINALKEVITVSKTMINLREQQLIELKNKLQEIEESLADKEANMLSADLKQEYERQLQNIRTLRGLYEERARLAEVTRQSLVRELEEQKLLTQAETAKNASFTERVAELEATVNQLEETLENKKEVIASYQDEIRGLQTEMTAVNTLFSQVLLGYKTNQDLDKLVHRLEENHGLLTHMAERENGSEASSALPKLLLEIVSQVDDIEERDRLESTIQGSREEQTVVNVDTNDMRSTEDSVSGMQNPGNTSAEEIVQNLPKVWRVLTELLSHQSVTEAGTSEKMETCYKSVETNAGPVLVPSVSQTYIRLKDLIIEKLALIKEVNRMKQLNGHLETRLEEQERRLSLVTTELSKTWHVVGRLRRHHHQLHTHEKILKYELQQKRKLLNELKDELEYCREKWEQAREKNSQSERDWRKLRAEFTSRKTKSTSPSFNHSGESGYSDERPSDDSSESNDESEYVTEPMKRCKKKNKRAAEPILDSSADFNLVAEREDPPSDMLDVAELPLDTQDDTSGLEVSVSISNSNNANDDAHKNTKASDETEDEVGDIANDSCNDDSSGVEHYCNTDYCCVGTSVDIDTSNDDDKAATNSSHVQSQQDLPDVPIINAAAILKSIKEQTERLAKKDERLNNLEKNSSTLLKKSQETDKLSKQIDSTLDHLLNRPTTSKQFETAKVNHIPDAGVISDTRNVDSSRDNIDNDEIKRSDQCGEVTALSGDIETILESDVGVPTKLHRPDTNTQTTEGDTALPNMPLASNDALGNYDVSKVESSPTAERASDGEIYTELVNETFGSPRETQKDAEDLVKTDDNSIPARSTPEPSTSSDTNHEARFAARDLRLKRLEEQTKSLVNRVNKTTSKGVKIHYKLEELHNIYGSEGSRAGTPSDETEEKTQENEENEEEEDK